MDAETFLSTIFDGAQGAVVTVNAEDGFRARRWAPGKRLSGTVYFCISTVKDPRPRDQVLTRQTHDLVSTYAIVLDDVGTKVSRETLAGLLPPSYRLETSAGNEQWGYILDEGCEPARAAALIEALAREGLTDMGARRADRIMRLPGSVNVPKGNFIATLLEWEPSRLYSFTDICVGLKVTPTDTLALSGGPAELPSGMVDPLFQWLVDHGHVLDGPNPRGWYPVRCPQEHLHSGEVDHGTDYKPGMPGVFKCQHGHCTGLTRTWLSDWILEQDPGADLSVMPRSALEGLGKKLAGALGVKPSSVEGQDSQTEIGSEGLFQALQRQVAAGSMFAKGLAVREAVADEVDAAAQLVLDDIIHVASESKFWSRTAGCLLDAKAVDNRWYPVMAAAGLLDRPKRLPMKPHEWLMQHPGMERVSRLVHRLGAPLIVDDCLNVAPPVPERVPYSGEPTPWLDAISFICKGNEEEIDWFLDWCAFVVTAWDEKPGFHLILKGKQGTGKNLALLPVVQYLKPDHHQAVTTAMVGGQFTAFLTKRLLSIDELKMTSRGAATAHDIYNNLKAWTARGAATVTINEKNMKHFEASDRSCWAITSNEAVPLPIEDDDRRFMVLETPRRRQPKEWYRRIYEWLEGGGGYGVVIGWLQRRWDEMDAGLRQGLREPAPMTQAKLDIQEVASEGIEGAVRLSISGRHGEAWPDLMRLDDVVERLKLNQSNLLSAAAVKMVSAQRVISALHAAGAVRLFEGQVVRDGDTKMRLWCVRGHKAAEYEAQGQNKVGAMYADQRKGIVPKEMSNVLPFKPV